MRLALTRNTTIAIAVFGSLLLVLFNASQWYMYHRTRNLIESRVTDEVLSIAQSTAAQVDQAAVEDIVSGSESIEDYSSLITTIDNIKEAHDLLNLDLYDRNGISLSDWMSDSSRPSNVLNPAEFMIAEVGIPAATDLYRSDSLYLISAYAPVIGYADSAIAVVVVEAGYDFVGEIDKYRRNVILINVASIVFAFILLLSLIVINRRLVRSEQALLRASAISSMGRMAATVAHEIRNPLSIIKNSAERIRTKYGSDKDDPAFGFISEEVDRLNSVVASYLDFAHPATQRHEEFDIRNMIQTLLEQVRTDLRNAGVEADLNCKPPNAECSMTGDRFAIRQAILNLIINARDALPDGGQIDLEIVVGDNIELSISDNGIGISSDELGRIFEPFVTNKEKGSGLGLYIAKSAVEANGGKLEIESKVGKGTRTTITLPRGD
jgi:signal transduction histidine kinase